MSPPLVSITGNSKNGEDERKKHVHFSTEDIIHFGNQYQFDPKEIRNSSNSDAKINIPPIQTTRTFFLIEKNKSYFKILKKVLLYPLALLAFAGLTFIFIISQILRFIVYIIFSIFYRNELELIKPGFDSLSACEAFSSPSNIVVALKFTGIPDFEKIIKTFERKILEDEDTYARLQWIVKEKFLFFCWFRDKEFNTRNHFTIDETGDNDKLEKRVEQIICYYLKNKLDTTKPQWRVKIVNQKNIGVGKIPEFYLLFVVHHSYGDGLSFLQLFKNLADRPFRLTIDPMSIPSSKSANSAKSPLIFRLLRKVRKLVHIPHYFALQSIEMLNESNAFIGPIANKTKSCKWTNIPLDKIKSIRSAKIPDGKSLSFTSIFANCITVALQQSYAEIQAEIPIKILAGTPYASFPYKSMRPVNNFSMSLLPLETGVFNRRTRLKKCEENSINACESYRSEINKTLMNFWTGNLTIFVKLCTLLCRSTISLSNIPGPKESFSFLDNSASELLIFPPMKFSTAISIGIVGFCEKVNLTISVDESVSMKNPMFAAKFLEAVENELNSLYEEIEWERRAIEKAKKMKPSISRQKINAFAKNKLTPDKRGSFSFHCYETLDINEYDNSMYSIPSVSSHPPLPEIPEEKEEEMQENANESLDKENENASSNCPTIDSSSLLKIDSNLDKIKSSSKDVITGEVYYV